MEQLLGRITHGTLSGGLIMRVAPTVRLDLLKTGKFVSIMSEPYTFFSIITDLTLDVSQTDIIRFPPDVHNTLLTDFLRDQDIFALAELRPMLMFNRDKKPMPVKTIPLHFSPVYEASSHDIAHVFGTEEDKSKRYFAIGTPLDMERTICLDLHRFTQRSNAIFGKTGTGKTFLTRLILSGLIKHEKAVPLIFDMHSEYGLQARSEGATSFVKGLKTLFPSKVALFSLDPQSTRRRGGAADVNIMIDYASITVEDVLSLQDELNLHSTAFEAAYLIAARYHHEWLEVLLSRGNDCKEFAQELGAHPESIAALYRKLKRLERLPFLQKAPVRPSPLELMMDYLDRGIGVIVEFGNHTQTFVYLLLASIITRRIHAAYIQKTEQFLGSHRKEDEPKHLLITIEEAHKFLNPRAARQTIFGTISREMRKYYVSLLIIDQRPSSIEPEIISQIGTKIIAQLNDEKDIAAVLTGAGSTHNLRTVLGSLDSTKQVLLMGHAVPMPVVIETRPYDEQFYQAMMESPIQTKSVEHLIRDIF